MEQKNHKITTVQDMIDCTDAENLDRFLNDLKDVIKTAHALTDQIEEVGKAEGLPPEARKVVSDGFEWIDDGTDEQTLVVKV